MGFLCVVLALLFTRVGWHRLRNGLLIGRSFFFVDEQTPTKWPAMILVERDEDPGVASGSSSIRAAEDRMNRTHKLARGDHDDLSQRVAHQMRDVINPALAPCAPERPGQQHRHLRQRPVRRHVPSGCERFVFD